MVPVALMVLLSPTLVAERSVGSAVFPDGAENWDRVGLFELRDGNTTRRVLLYCHDSDSVMEKEIAKKGSAMGFYPNSFALHALYETAPGKWVHVKPYSRGRVRLNKAIAVDGGVDVEFRGNFQLTIKLGEDNKEALEQVVKANKPFTERMVFKNGALVVE